MLKRRHFSVDTWASRRQSATLPEAEDRQNRGKTAANTPCFSRIDHKPEASTTGVDTWAPPIGVEVSTPSVDASKAEPGNTRKISRLGISLWWWKRGRCILAASISRTRSTACSRPAGSRRNRMVPAHLHAPSRMLHAPLYAPPYNPPACAQGMHVREGD